ncbi:MAG: hypothetical protein ACSNEK_07965 [Parachlamydiaceae bacterium]
MSMSFISIAKNEDENWYVVRKGFPFRSLNQVKPCIDHTWIECCFDKRTASVAAKRFAEENRLAFYPYDQQIVTILPLGGGYLPILLEREVQAIGPFADDSASADRSVVKSSTKQMLFF